MRRPDHAGYAVDPMPEVMLADGEPLYVIQVWVDAARPEAHRDPALRAYLALMAQRHGMPALVRWSHPDGQVGRDAMFLAAPCLSQDQGWVETLSPMIPTEDLDRKIAASGRPVEMKITTT